MEEENNKGITNEDDNNNSLVPMNVNDEETTSQQTPMATTSSMSQQTFHMTPFHINQPSTSGIRRGRQLLKRHADIEVTQLSNILRKIKMLDCDWFDTKGPHPGPSGYKPPLKKQTANKLLPPKPFIYLEDKMFKWENAARGSRMRPFCPIAMNSLFLNTDPSGQIYSEREIPMENPGRSIDVNRPVPFVTGTIPKTYPRKEIISDLEMQITRVSQLSIDTIPFEIDNGTSIFFNKSSITSDNFPAKISDDVPMEGAMVANFPCENLLPIEFRDGSEMNPTLTTELTLETPPENYNYGLMVDNNLMQGPKIEITDTENEVATEEMSEIAQWEMMPTHLTPGSSPGVSPSASNYSGYLGSESSLSTPRESHYEGLITSVITSNSQILHDEPITFYQQSSSNPTLSSTYPIELDNSSEGLSQGCEDTSFNVSSLSGASLRVFVRTPIFDESDSDTSDHLSIELQYEDSTRDADFTQNDDSTNSDTPLARYIMPAKPKNENICQPDSFAGLNLSSESAIGKKRSFPSNSEAMDRDIIADVDTPADDPNANNIIMEDSNDETTVKKRKMED